MRNLSEQALDAVDRAMKRGVQGAAPRGDDTVVNDVTPGGRKVIRRRPKHFISPYSDSGDRFAPQRIPLPGMESEEPLDQVDRPPEWAPYHHPQKQRASRSPYNVDKNRSATNGVLDMYAGWDEE